ncbi:MAG: hypothetical protein ACKV22_06655 [Bryobacteraceae bacterium]
MSDAGPIPCHDRAGAELPNFAYSEDGVDLTLIRWMLSLTPDERLDVLQDYVNAILAVREANAPK